MFAIVVLLVLSANGDAELAPMRVPACASVPVARAYYYHWLSSYPYSQRYYAQHGYDFRREFNIPWSVRASYSMPVDAAASTRRFGADVTDEVASPQAVSPLPAPREPNARGATSSK